MTELTPGFELGARFVLLRWLGRGGTAEVWLADDRARTSQVALKVLDGTGEPPPGWATLLASQALPADHIVALRELVRLDGRTLLVMDLMEGGDLGQFRGRPFESWADALDHVVAALAALHAAGFVHRDLKCSNVLLDGAGRARLADFGLLTPIGAPGSGGGSPYSASPQQLRGEAARPADDLYALGALLYELVSGHPPYYPEITRERVLYEPVPPLLPLAAVPVRVRELALRLLAKSAAGRPELSEVRAVLAAARAAEHAAEPAPVAALGRAVAARTRARTALWLGSAMLAAAALAVVFVALPRWTAERNARLAMQARAEAAAQNVLQRQREEQAQRQAAARAAATAARDRYDSGFAALDARQAVRWAVETLAAARAGGEEAAQQFDLGDFERAAGAWQEAGALLDRINAEAPAVVQRLLAQATTALGAARTREAREALELVLAIEPQNGAARAGLERARHLEAALALADAAADDERAGRLEAAEQGYRRALAEEANVPGVRAALARLAATRSGDAFAAALARGLAERTAGRFAAARAAFEQALALRPGAPEVQQALAELEQGQRGATLLSLESQARAAESDERWSEALAAWREATALEPGLVKARDGIARVTPRLELQDRIEALVGAPERLWDARTRAGARALLEAAARAVEPRRRLGAAAAELGRMVAVSETPLRLRLESDGLTQVVIWRVGQLGTFTVREVELLPGRYTVVGTRTGYRDVRREVEVRPGAQPAVATIRCEEPV